MGACEVGACCGVQNTAQYNIDTFKDANVGPLMTEELDGKKIEISMEGNGTALLRHQMLYEDFSHIYDSKFASKFTREVTLI